MKYLYYLILIYYSYLGIFFSINNDISFNDIDFDRNHILTISELASSFGKRYKCYTKNKVIENTKLLNIEKCERLELEIFSYKDGLTIKTILLKTHKNK